jgi:phosphodiesterase/alkaline phosphatase D-like protein
VTAKMHIESTDVRLLIDDVSLTAAESTDADMMCRFDLTGLAADTEHTYQVQVDGEVRGPVGRFKTMPSGAPAGTACNFTCALGGDANTGSTSNAFHRVRLADPLFFIHLGDLHYENISTNSPALFQAAYDTVLRGEPQARLYRDVPTVYVWDDHDYGANNSDGSSASKPAAASTYRSRVPHYPLEEATGIYHSFDVGRVRFIVTDQRSAASPNSDTDNSSKTMLGVTQKAWFKNLLSNSPGMLIVWVCPRWMRQGTIAGTDSWAGFTTERAELWDHIQANCSGRVVILSADLHTLGIDDGTNFDFATIGSEPIPVFQAAALDQSPVSGGDTYSEGEFLNTGQWGSMQIADSGGATIGVTWRGHNSTGATIVTLSFSVSV